LKLNGYLSTTSKLEQVKTAKDALRFLVGLGISIPKNVFGFLSLAFSAPVPYTRSYCNFIAARLRHREVF
jgi:hypothetical protein